MISLLRLLTVILLSGCGTIDPTYIGYAINYFNRDKFLIDEPLIDSMPYSFVHIKQASNNAIFVLSDITGQKFKWVGPNSEYLVTINGLIIESSGLDNDISFLYNERDLIANFPSKSFVFEVSLSNPELEYHKYKMRYLKNDNECYEYVRSSDLIESNFVEKYCFENKLAKSSVQRISPINKKIELEFYYKF